MSEGFELGERVYIDGAYSAPGHVGVVDHRTPTGRVRVAGVTYRPDGRAVGADKFSRGRIRKLTPQLEERAQFGVASEQIRSMNKGVEQTLRMVKTAEHAERVKAALQVVLDEIANPPPA